MIPVVDMCSGTGELSAATQEALSAPTGLASLSDSDSRAREYLAARWPAADLYDDCRDQDVPDRAITTIGAPCQDLSYAGGRDTYDNIAAQLRDNGYKATVVTASNLSRRARIRLAGNAVVGRQAALMLVRALVQLNPTI